jgi:peptide/nickel transport system permease protein
MGAFLMRRLALLIVVIFGILAVTFFMVRLIPGDPCIVMLGEKATKEKCDAFKERFGLNDTLPVQFGRYLGNLARGDFGTSIKEGRPVNDILAERLPMTIELTLFATVFATALGVLLGVISAVRQNSAADVGAMVVANVGVSMPIFWLGLLLAYLFALTLKDTPFALPPSSRLPQGLDFPSLLKAWNMEDSTGLPRFATIFYSNAVFLRALTQGRFDVLLAALRHMVLPAVAVGTVSLAIIARMSRGAMLDVLSQDFVRVARAKGLRERMVIAKHAFRNALVPIVTVIGIQFGGLLGGAVLTETTFLLPGIGTRLIDAILARDYPVVQAFTVVIALLTVFVNLIVDLSYAYLNPRIRVQ